MADSIVDASNHQDKMGETASSNPVLEVSVSFGRFENDSSLAWEKWSTFSPNKYLEEVEKCATPGSVAQKAAYFEAHYKKIAARKAELLDQEKQMEDNLPMRLHGRSCVEPVVAGYRVRSEFDESDGYNDGVVANGETHVDNEVNVSFAEKPSMDPAAGVEDKNVSVEEIKEMESGLGDSKLGKQEEGGHVLVEEVENASTRVEEVQEANQKERQVENVSMRVEDIQKANEKEGEAENALMRVEDVREAKEKIKESSAKTGCDVKLDHPKQSRKVSSTSKDRNTVRVKKNPTSAMTSKQTPVPKSPQTSTPRVSKLTATSTPVSSSRSSSKIGSGSSLSRSKNQSTIESKKVAPKSLHMSISLGPSGSGLASASPSQNTTRKSLIMERMGDKEIVKRAFKTFQNSYMLMKSAGEERSTAPKKVPSKGTEAKVSTLTTPRKETAESFKANSAEKKNAKSAPSSLASKSDERAEKRREFSRGSGEKSTAKGTERTPVQPILKVDKEAESKKVRQMLNSKTTAMSGLYRGQKVSKGSLDKEGPKNVVHR